MNMRILGISLLVLALGISAFVFLRPQESQPQEREMAISEEAVSADTESPVEAIVSPSQQTLPLYSPEAVEEVATEGKALLFFHAAWCPFCRAAEEDILMNYDQIPDDVTIFKVDYDTEKELRTQYSVTTQHTFVQVDADGNEVTKWVGGETLKDILSRLE